MANIHIYFGIENLAMNQTQKDTLHDVLKQLGIAPNDPSPARRPHWRWRLDGEAVIYEALFDEDDLSLAAFRQHMAAAFGVAVGDISTSTQNTVYGRVFTFRYVPNATDYFRMVAFGFDGSWPSWLESGAAAQAYLAANAAEWDEETPG